ncbi:MAG: hypothetical protein GYA73_10105 [Planctomycetes bacterium]|nr:hypothetical protein [Planctomycetota bacterium]
MMARIAYEHRGALGVPFARSRGLTEGDLETLYAAGAEAVRLLAEERPHPLLMDGGMLMTRWKRFPERAMAEDMAGKLTRAARRFSRGAGDIVSVGIGGSYLGGAAVVQALTHSQSAMAAKARGRAPRVHFLGEQLDPDLIAEKLEALDPDRTAVIVISKSGTTTETAVMFRLMADWLGPARMRERLVAVTDARSGALREAVRRYGLNGCIDADLAPFFNVPDGIGGRFSALTAAGLFAVAAAGIDVEALLVGARCAEEEGCRRPEPAANMALRRAAVRAAFMLNEGAVERLVSNSWHLGGILSWARQLYPESDGKDGRGLSAVEALYSREAHSDGQLVAQGPRNIKEVFYLLERFTRTDLAIPALEGIADGLDKTAAAHSVNQINRAVCEALLYDHITRGVPVDVWRIPERTPFVIGQLLQSEMNAVLIECLILRINGVNQPGVAGYKNAMFGLLGREGSDPALAGRVAALLGSLGLR